jgi:hypothetical protein
MLIRRTAFRFRVSENTFTTRLAAGKRGKLYTTRLAAGKRGKLYTTRLAAGTAGLGASNSAARRRRTRRIQTRQAFGNHGKL